MEVRAVARGVGISAQKVRRIVDMVRGKKAEEALVLLRFITSPAAKAVAKAVKSAMANAETNHELSPADLRITRILVDEGPMLKRYRPQSRGRISPILKRTSHITVIVSEEERGA